MKKQNLHLVVTMLIVALGLTTGCRPNPNTVRKSAAELRKALEEPQVREKLAQIEQELNNELAGLNPINEEARVSLAYLKDCNYVNAFVNRLIKTMAGKKLQVDSASVATKEELEEHSPLPSQLSDGNSRAFNQAVSKVIANASYKIQLIFLDILKQ